MASNGLDKKAIKGTCRMCLRVRYAYTQVKPVGEVRHGYATGHIWECINHAECDEAIDFKLRKNTLKAVSKAKIEQAQEVGRYITYKCFH